jgi:hypothetical protein
MKNERIIRFFPNRIGTNRLSSEHSPSGFTTNPFASAISSAQASLYQAAFERAQRDVQKHQWANVQFWN